MENLKGLVGIVLGIGGAISLLSDCTPKHGTWVPGVHVDTQVEEKVYSRNVYSLSEEEVLESLKSTYMPDFSERDALEMADNTFPFLVRHSYDPHMPIRGYEVRDCEYSNNGYNVGVEWKGKLYDFYVSCDLDSVSVKEHY